MRDVVKVLLAESAALWSLMSLALTVTALWLLGAWPVGTVMTALVLAGTALLVMVLIGDLRRAWRHRR